MLKYNNYLLVLIIFISFLFIPRNAYAATGDTLWAKSTTVGPDISSLAGTATDSQGNVYVSGGIVGSGTFDFGNGVTVAGSYASSWNIVTIKYNSQGVAQWAKSVGAGAPNISVSTSINIDASDNIYVAGSFSSISTFDFGNGVSLAGGNSAGNALLIKYNTDGQTQWAKSTGAGAPGQSYFNGVTTDSGGDIYVGGYITGTSSYDFGNSITVSAGFSGRNNVVVKYNSQGVAQWAKSTGAGAPGVSTISSMTSDSNGVYSGGWITGTSSYDFGNGITVSGGYSTNNATIVKYNFEGQTQWAKSISAGATNFSIYYSITTDSSGNIYAGGITNSTAIFDFGNSVTVAGGNASNNILVVKYNSLGLAQWAKSTGAGGPGYSISGGITTDSYNNVYVVGIIATTGTFDFGNGITVAGGFSTNNAAIIKYNSEGLTQWAKSTGAGAPGSSALNAVKADRNNNIFVSGYITSTGSLDFGNEITVSGGNVTKNSVVVKYEGLAPLVATISSSAGVSFSGYQCNNQKPATSPNLFRIDKTKTSAKLYFAPVSGSVDRYYIAYGQNKNNLLHGVEFIQGSSTGVLSYTVNLLSPNTIYYFKIRGGNGCMPGDWSDVLGTKINSKQRSLLTTPKVLEKKDDLPAVSKEENIEIKQDSKEQIKTSFIEKIKTFFVKFL